MGTVCNVTAGDLRHRADNWFDWDEIRLKLGLEFLPLELGLNQFEDCDWTSVAQFRLLLDEMGDSEELKFCCRGRNFGVVGVDDFGEPLLIVEEI